MQRNYFLLFQFLIFRDCCSYSNTSGERSEFAKTTRYVLGALIPVHDKGENTFCGEKIIEYEYDAKIWGYSAYIDTQHEFDSMQAIEALYFAIDSINKNDMLPDVVLEIDIKDDCNNAELSSIRAMKFVEKSCCDENKTTDEYLCGDNNGTSTLLGVILPSKEEISTKVESIFNSFAISQVSYSGPTAGSIQEQLSNSNIADLAFSVTSKDFFVPETVIAILLNYNWTNVAVVYERDSHSLGNYAVKRFQNLAPIEEICIGEIIEIEDIQRNHLENFQFYSSIDVIICFCSPYGMVILHSAVDNDFYDTEISRFIIIAGDGRVSTKPFRKPGNNYESIKGEILIAAKPQYSKEFDEYYLSRNLENNQRNPWFREFWEQHFNCKFNPGNESESSKCTGTEKLEDGYHQSPKVSDIIKAVYSLSEALRSWILQWNGKVVQMHASTLFSGFPLIKNFTFNGEEMRFTQSRNLLTPVRYLIHSFQRQMNGSYGYVQIGDFMMEYQYPAKFKRKLNIFGDAQFSKNKSAINAFCTEICSPGFAKVFRNHSCCWDCRPCQRLDILINSTLCQTCQKGYMPNNNKTACTRAPIKNPIWYGIPSLISTCFSSICIILIAFTTCIFLKYRDTPVVKSATRELCYVMFGGMILANLTPFVSLLPPNAMSCGCIRVIPSISFTMVYAALLVKTNRIARLLVVSKKKFPNMNLKYMSLKAQIIITFLMVFVEICMSVYSLWKHNPEPHVIYLFDEDEISPYYGLRMCTLNEPILLESFSFVALLVLICTYYAIKTRNLPENFNEAKCIGLSMYATILTGMAFGLVYFTSQQKRLAVNLCVSINSLVILLFIFTPKLYIMLWKPEKNTKANFTTTTTIRSYLGKEER